MSETITRAGFIVLTETRLGYGRMQIRPEHITAVFRAGDGGAALWVRGVDDPVMVKESPAVVDELIYVARRERAEETFADAADCQRKMLANLEQPT